MTLNWMKATLYKMRKPLVVSIIIKINIIVFFLWFIFGYEPSFMIRHFLVSWEAVSEGRIWTLITSVFSHNMLFHIFINMFVFYGFGMTLEKVFGPYRFLRFYLAAGITGSIGHCLVSTMILGMPEVPALGASGAISGVILLFSLMFPKEKLLILGLIPIPAIWGALMFVALDLWGLIAQSRGSTLPIGYGAHLGGALCGMTYYILFVRKKVVIKQI